MGVRGELFSTKVSLQNRTYFFNVKENRLGDLYLNIVESKNRDEGGFERQSVILFAEDLQEFLKGFDESLRVLEKAAREKRRGKGSPSNSREADGGGREFDRGGRDYDKDSRNYPAGGRDSRKDRDYGKGESSRRPGNSGPERKNDGAGRGFRTDRDSPQFHDRPGRNSARFSGEPRTKKPRSVRQPSGQSYGRERKDDGPGPRTEGRSRESSRDK